MVADVCLSTYSSGSVEGLREEGEEGLTDPVDDFSSGITKGKDTEKVPKGSAVDAVVEQKLSHA